MWPVIRATLPLLILFALLWFAIHLVRRLSAGRSSTLESIPFRKKDYLLSAAERTFFEILRQVVGQECHVFVKVRMGRPSRVIHRPCGKIQHVLQVRQKHLDFVICDREKVSPRLVIELDDSTHQSENAKARDAVKDAILNAAGLPVLRVLVRRNYDLRELREVVLGRLAATR